MENNFEVLLDTLLSSNKGKFLGLLRRNGVVVNSDISNEALRTKIVSAMQKSETFKKEALLLITTIVTQKGSDDGFSNVTGNTFQGKDFGTTIFGTNTTPATTTPSSAVPTASTPTLASTESGDKKTFSETFFGQTLNWAGNMFNTYTQSKEIDLKKKELDVLSNANSGSGASQAPQPTQKSKVGLYVGLGVLGVAIVGGIVYFVNKK
jgi:hypothetical protein